MPNRESLGYFREVLLTYHILFGHDKTSRALFTRVGPTLSRDPIADPLLPIFCGQGSSKLSRDIYEEVYIDTSAKSSQFSAFPLFGERILRLEAHIKSCRPEAFSATWYDKTIASTWVTYWVGYIISQPLPTVTNTSTVNDTRSFYPTLRRSSWYLQ